MKLFTVNRNICIACETKNTRNGFKHEATLLLNGAKIESVKIFYLNRTWEEYEYESVLRKLLEKSGNLTISQHKAFKRKLKNKWRENESREVKKQLKTIATVASLGNIFSDNQQQANDWKARMLQAGLPGLSMPDNWDNLPETEKQHRLDAVIHEIEGKNNV